MNPKKIDFCFNEIKEMMSSCFSINKHDLKGIDKWKELWMNSKSHFFPYFDENGRKQITISKEELETIDKMTLTEILKDIDPLCRKMINSGKYSREIRVPQLINYLNNILCLFTPEEIINNKIITTSITDPARPEKFIPKGAKVSKYVNNLMNYSHFDCSSDEIRKQLIDFVNVAYSQFLNSIINYGSIVLSINPIDYLLVSAHTTGWKSCHNFMDGCYKTGGVSYMLDSVSLVGYAYTEQKPIKVGTYESNFDWPIKIWRAMVFMDLEHHSAAISRQYPDKKNIYAKYLRKLVGRTLADMAGAKYKWKTKDECCDCGEDHDVTSDSPFNYYDPISSIIKLKDIGSIPYIETGVQEMPCIICGEYRTYKDNNNDPAVTFVCDDCDAYVCYNCGCRCDDPYEVDGNYYCEDCYYDLFTTCSSCSDVIHVDNAYYYGDDPICEWCRDRYFAYCNNCNCLERIENLIYVYDTGEDWCNDCVEDYIHHCHGCGNYFEHDIVQINNRYYCSHCAENFHCECCGEYSFNIVNGLCENCINSENSEISVESGLESVGV